MRCRRAPLEEVLAKLADLTGHELRWESVSAAARARSVTLDLDEVIEQRLAEVACGTVGLVARFTGEQTLVSDPDAAPGIAEKRDLLAREAMANWRRAFLRWGQDPRQADGEYALAATYQAAGDVSGALTQYHLVADRYAAFDAAPRSLLQAARLRMSIRDFAGAHADLLALLDSHPRYSASDEAYLFLGRSALESNQLVEAARAFRKLYYLDLSPDSKVQACLGLGTCLARQGKHEEAARWLGEYLQQARQMPPADVRDAATLLARAEAAQGRLSRAVKALRMALAAETVRSRQIQMSLELADLLLRARDFTGALGEVHRAESMNPTEEQFAQATLLQSRIYRAVGVPGKAASLIKGRISSPGTAEFVPVLKAELGRCQAADGDLAAARVSFTEALARMKDGPDAWETTADLAQTCLSLGDPEQAIVLARELIRPACPDATRQKGYEILAGAHAAGRDYVSAAGAYEHMQSLAEPRPEPPRSQAAPRQEHKE